MKFSAHIPILLALLLASTCAAQLEEVEHFITQRVDQLFDGEQEFRFISFNIPNLHLVEDNFAPGYDGPFCWPDAYEIDDALESVRQMGGNVVRTYVLSVARDDSGMGDTVFVFGPGNFNEEAFKTLDLVLKTARDKDIRVLVPLVDQWHWMGGRAQYAGFRGKQPDDFWTDEEVIRDFEETIRYVLNRQNSLTGVAYKDDPTIFGWETGNEIDAPAPWTKRIAALIKNIDSKHLVIDGCSLRGVRQESLDDENIDVVTTHHYPGPGRDMLGDIRRAREATRGKKPYFVGEFGFVPLAEVQQVLDLVVNDGISGALIWSLRYHHRDGGFYWHSEPLGAGLYKAYHWPGFANGAAYEELEVLNLMRARAFQIRGLSEPTPSAPVPPTLLPIADVSAISWQGSTGASAYDVFRAPAAEGPWQLVGEGVVDSHLQYVPLFHDDTAVPGASYFYRVVARNVAGSSEPSNTVGPVAVAWRTLVDDCADLSLLKSRERAEPTTGDDRKTREDKSRLKLSPGGHVTYYVAEAIQEWAVAAFFTGENDTLRVSCSADGAEFTACEFEQSAAPAMSADYGYLRFATLRGTSAPRGTRYLRLETPRASSDAVQLSRVVIRHGSK